MAIRGGNPKAGALRVLLARATAARANSYSPYSGRKVGAAVRTRSGKIYAGCNVENSSYGGTVCAERVAIASAVAAEGAIELTDVAVVTDARPAWPPCGICRQVIAEFGPNAVVHASDLKGNRRSRRLSELLPEAFTARHLRARKS